MSKVADSESQENNSAGNKTAMERLSLMIEEAPKALSEVKEWLKTYYPSKSSAEQMLSQENCFKIVFVKKDGFEGQVLVAASRESDEDYWKKFWKVQRENKKQEKVALARDWTAAHTVESKVAHDELYRQLSESPARLSDLGYIGKKYGVPRPITDKKDDQAYWGRAIRSKMSRKTVANPSDIMRGIDTEVSSRYVTRPFFCGRLQRKRSRIGFKTSSFSVVDVVSAVDGAVADIDLPGVQPKGNVVDREFIVGIPTPKGGSYIFFNQKRDSAVQVLLWSSFKESDDEPSPEKYFEKNVSGQLMAKTDNIIGNEKAPGYVIITDGKDGYWKGFLSIGKGAIKYASIHKYDGDFSKVAQANQVTEMNYKGFSFAILVPQQGNVDAHDGKHAVIDCEGWVPLGEVHKGEESKTTDVFNGEVVKAVHPDKLANVESQKTSRLLRAEKGVDEGEKEDVVVEPAQGNNPQKREDPIGCDWNTDEMAFLSVFEEYVNDCGFKYETADLVRLHTSVKCSMCTLLAGNPGTGKSSLAELYMRAVAGSPEKDDAERSWRQIFVNPAWMEPADLLGYETDGGFRHAPSHLAEFIRNISEGENLPMGIVCFEEMNLACVEHYFSDFIQIMSRGMGVIPGCKDNGLDLFVEQNFRVIGTCNSDETTRPLSPRFLSRCNTIELASSFETTKKLVTDLADGNAPEIKPFVGREPITYGTFKRWCESSRDIDNIIVNAILSLLGPKDGNESIMSDAGFDMSGRIVSDMFTYIRNRPPYEGNNSFLTEAERQKVALDEFLAQRVFFACRPTPGTITAINTLYDNVNKGFEIEVSGKGDQNVNSDVLKLPLSAELLKRRIDDYTKRIMQV